MKEKEHLPLFGVGPIIIALQVIITVIGIVISYCGHLDFGEIELLNVPLKFIGIGWIYMTVFLKLTEEKWLAVLYGKEYIEYCKRVNRCIPWFSRRKCELN